MAWTEEIWNTQFTNYDNKLSRLLHVAFQKEKSSEKVGKIRDFVKKIGKSREPWKSSEKVGK